MEGAGSNDGGQRVDIRLLGRFVVEVGGRSITEADFERRTGAELVQLLALSPDRRLHRERVIDALWPELAIRSATNQFHKAASFARSALGDKRAVIVRDEVVALFTDAEVVTDVDIVLGAAPDDAASVDAAIAANEGELLPSVPYADWAIEHRERIRLRFHELLAEAGRWDRLVELDPTNEPANVALMEASLAVGDRSGVIRRFDDLAARLEDELGVEPGPAAVEIRNRAQHLVAAVDPAPHHDPLALADGTHLPAGPTTAGRRHEIERIDRALADHRLVSLIGPGGIGKTHLALAVAAERVAEGAGTGPAVALCRYGRVDDPAGVHQETLASLGARQQTDATVLESIVRTIGERPLLLVFDNCEHLVGAAGELAATILSHCPGVRILVTSRAPLGLDIEHQLVVGPLDRAAAISLFVTEAGRQDVTVDPDAPVVDEICRRLDDLPLGVRLAAARTRAMDLTTLAGALASSLQLLGDDRVPGPGAGPDQARTLREAVAWSFATVSPEAQALLIALSVFADRFGLEDALAVVGPGRAQADSLNQLDELVANSLLAVERVDDRVGYRLLEAIRLFARDRGLDPEVRGRHLTRVREQVERASDELSTDSASSLDRFDRLWSDLRVAVTAAVELDRRGDALAIVAACATYANLVLQFEVIEWCEQVLDPADTPGDATHAAALATWSTLITHRNEMDRARAITERAADGYGREPSVLYARSWIPWSDADLPVARALLDELVDLPDVPVSIEAGALTLQSVLLWAQGGDVGPCAHRVGVIAAGRGPLYEAEALITGAIRDIWVDADAAFAALDQAQILTDGHGLHTLGAVVRAARGVALSVAAPIEDALAAIRANLDWTRRNGFWNYAMAGSGTCSMALERAGRLDIAVTIISARQSNGFVAGFNAEFVNAVTEQARVEHPTEFETWWASGRRLDPRATTDLGIATIDAILDAG